MGKRITTEYYCDACSAVVQEQDLIPLNIPDLYESTPTGVPETGTLELCTTCAADYSSRIKAVLQQFLHKQDTPAASGQGHYTGLDAAELPAGAVYVAADESGAVHWYCDKPARVQHGWLAEDMYQDTRVPGVTYTGDWRDSLLQVVKIQPEPQPDALMQAILDAPQHAELPAETASYGEADGDWPPLDVSKLKPPAKAHWVAVDKDGRAYYYPVKPLCGKSSWYSPGYPVVGKAPGRYDTSNWQEAVWPVNPDSQPQVEQPPKAEQPCYGTTGGGDKPKVQISGALVASFAPYASKLVEELPGIKTAQQYQGIIDADKYTDMFAPAIAKKLMQLADRPDWSHYCVVCSTGDAYWLSSLHKDSAEFKLMHIGSGFCTFDWSSSLVTDLPAFKYDIESCESRINYVAINASGSLMGFIDRPCFQPAGVWSAPSRLCEIPDFGMFDARYCDSSLRRIVRDGRPKALRIRDAAKLDVTKLKPPAEARWVAVDESGRAWYYTSKPHVEENGWTCGEDGELLTMEPGVFDTSNWQEEVYPVNLEQGS